MGPGDVDSKGSSLSDPPMYSPDCYQQEWRRRVGRWVDILKTAHDSGKSRHFQTVYKIIGLTLFERGLPQDQKALFAEAQDNGTIDYLQIDDPVAAVRKIVNTVAVDPPIAMVTRLISSFQNVTACRRGKNENLRVFVFRFRGLAATHPLHTDVSSSSHIAEVLAVTLLNNANLDEGTLINATSSLINHAQARDQEQSDAAVTHISKANLSQLLSIVNRMSELEKDRSIPKDSGERKRFMETFRSKSIHEIKRIVFLISDIINDILNDEAEGSVAKMFTSDQKHLTLNLDDAVKVLRALTQASSSNPGARYSVKEINAMFDRKVTALLATHEIQPSFNRKSGGSIKQGSSSEGKGSNSAPKTSKSKKRTREDKSTVGEGHACFGCGDPDHRRGSDQCPKPSYLTVVRKKRRSNTGQGSNENQDKNDPKPFFQKRSGEGYDKQA